MRCYVLKQFCTRVQKNMLICTKEARGLQIFKKETQTQMFSCEIHKIFKNTYFYRTSSMAASENIVPKSLIALLIENY